MNADFLVEANIQARHGSHEASRPPPAMRTRLPRNRSCRRAGSEAISRFRMLRSCRGYAIGKHIFKYTPPD